jgi:hypothetical protein
MTVTADVLVVGAGASGVCAAVAAAESGVRVILTEETTWVGGMLTGAGVSAMDGNHNLPSGLWDRFRRRLYAHYGGPAAVETGWISRTLYEPEVGEAILRDMLNEAGVVFLPQHRCVAALVDAPSEGGAPGALSHEQSDESGHRHGAATTRVRGGIFRRTVDDRERVAATDGADSTKATDDTELRIHATVTIAADEYGDFAYLTGLPLHTGLEGAEQSGEPEGPAEAYPAAQDLTYVATLEISGDLELLSSTVREDQTEAGASDAASHRTSGPSLSAAALPSFPHLLNDGAPESGHSWENFFTYARLPGSAFMLNWPIRGNDYHGDYLAAAGRGRLGETAPAARARELPAIRRHRAGALDAAKAKTLRLLRELQERFPEMRLRLRSETYDTADGLPPLPYIREAWRIYADPAALPPAGYLGLQHIRRVRARDDYSAPAAGPAPAVDAPADAETSPGPYARSVAVGDYPVDHHRKEDPHAPRIEFPRIPSFGLPVDVLIPRDVTGLLVAEKSIAVSGLANGCTRLQPVAMLLGEAAGVLAALTTARSMSGDPRDIAVGLLQERLLSRGCRLTPFSDVSLEDPDFALLQRAGVLGLLEGVSENRGWENHTLLRPDEPWNSAETRREYARRRLGERKLYE